MLAQPGDKIRLEAAAAGGAMRPSLPEAHGSVATAGTWLRRTLAFAGPGFLVAVGYMDPGNWATDLAGGAQFGYALLAVVLLSNLMAVVLQALCVRLGFATRRDLAQACRETFPRPVALLLWVVAELMIVACDLAEVIGSAIALNLLFGIPLLAGVLLTALDVMLILLLQHRGFRLLEAVIVALIATITLCFAVELLIARPSLGEVAAGFVPTTAIVTDPGMLYIAIGILGATVMPHNLYLHSSVVQTRAVGSGEAERRRAIRLATIDSTFALTAALFVNAAILILAATTFHASGQTGVADLEEAHRLLSPTLGAPLASTLFAVALLASGQNSTITGTLAGQIIMEGFLGLRLRPWLRRLLTRSLALIPAVIGIAAYGSRGTTSLLVLSQVVLSLQLPFAVIPLVMFTTSAKRMGTFRAGSWLAALAWAIAAFIVVLNGKMLYDLLAG